MDIDNLTPDLLFPRHTCGLYLSHNPHRDVYQTLAEYLAEGKKPDVAEDFADTAALARAIATDEYWELQWYPDTPVGFYVVAAPTLGELLQLAHRVAQEAEAEAQAHKMWP